MIFLSSTRNLILVRVAVSDPQDVMFRNQCTNRLATAALVSFSFGDNGCGMKLQIKIASYQITIAFLTN